MKSKVNFLCRIGIFRVKVPVLVSISDLIKGCVSVHIRETNETGPLREFRAFTANKIWMKYPYKDKIRTCSL